MKGKSCSSTVKKGDLKKFKKQILKEDRKIDDRRYERKHKKDKK